MGKLFAWIVAALPALVALPAIPAPLVDPLRGPTPVGEPTSPPPMWPVDNRDQRRTRAFSMQPPTIPHKIDGYQLDRAFNRCMDCHARERTGETQAVPLSVTHYQDRSGNVLAEVSPRRYFCLQCHVAQADTKPLVANNFKDVTAVMRTDAKPAPKKK